MNLSPSSVVRPPRKLWQNRAPSKSTVRQTTGPLSHDLEFFYGLCDDDEQPETELYSPLNEIRTLKTKVFTITSRYCKRNGHTASHCYDLSKLDSSDRHDFVMSGNLCFKCLEHGHVIVECTSEPKCTVMGCGKSHSPLLVSYAVTLRGPDWMSTHCSMGGVSRLLKPPRLHSSEGRRLVTML